MPRYLLQTSTIPSSGSGAATQLAARLFPEIALEHCYVAHDESRASATWVCRAPSEAHLYRWAEASGLGQVSVQGVDGDHSAQSYHDP